MIRVFKNYANLLLEKNDNNFCKFPISDGQNYCILIFNFINFIVFIFVNFLFISFQLAKPVWSEENTPQLPIFTNMQGIISGDYGKLIVWNDSKRVRFDDGEDNTLIEISIYVSQLRSKKNPQNLITSRRFEIFPKNCRDFIFNWVSTSSHTRKKTIGLECVIL